MARKGPLVSKTPNDNASAGGSVSRLVDGVKAGEAQAIEQLWRRYARELVALAHQRLGNETQRAVGADDVAVEAFLSFCRNAAAGKFEELATRQNVWALLATITIRKAFDVRKREQGRHAKVRGLSAAGETGLDAWAGKEPAPDFAARVASLLDLLPEELRPF